MAQISRRRMQQSQSRFRLMRTFLVAGGIVVLALLLFELDAFPSKKRNRRSINSITQQQLVSPEQVLRGHQEQQKLQVFDTTQEDESGDDEAAEETDDGGDDGTNVEETEEVDEGEDTLKPRRFVMTLGGLKDSTPEQNEVIFQTRPDWSPIGVEHLHKLIGEGFYNQCRFFRVVPHFVVQFGISGKPETQKVWRQVVLKDDPVQHTNERGTMTFATSGPNTRTTQLFINTKDNPGLDREGFSPIAVVLADFMEVIDRINDEYRQKPSQGKIQQSGNDYLMREFPNLSYIESIRPYDDTTIRAARTSPDEEHIEG